MAAAAPDWWGLFETVPSGLTEDQYVAAYEFREVSDARDKEAEVENAGAAFSAGLGVIHHGSVTTIGPDMRPVPGGCCPTHNVGRNADIFEAEAGRFMPAGANIAFRSIHMHANGRDTTGHIELGFKFHPPGYEPKYRVSRVWVTTNQDLIDVPAGATNLLIDAVEVLEENTKLTLFEPHMHASGVRFCLDAIYGTTTETLTCAGYDHSWVLAYEYEDDVAPLLPKGTILRIRGYYDNSRANRKRG